MKRIIHKFVNKKYIFYVCVFILLINAHNQLNSAKRRLPVVSFSRYQLPLDKQVDRQNVLSLISGKRYYIDPLKGNDKTGNGSSAKPWKTLKKAFFVVKGGDGVLLRTGNYGDFVEWKRMFRKKYIVYINDDGARPVFSQIKIRFNAYKPLPRAYYIFYGITIKPKWVDPASSGEPGSRDPYFPKATSYTYKSSRLPVDILNATKIRMYHCNIIGTNKYLTGGITLRTTRDISVVRCRISNVRAGVVFTNSTGINIFNNYVHNIIGTHFQDGGGCSFINVEANYGHDRHWSTKDKYAPRLKRYYPHGSFVAIRSSNFIVRNNIFHDGGESSGIMLYNHKKVKGYQNILIENNLVYDVHNNYVLRMYRVGKNIVVRNNTLVGRGRNTHIGAKKYNTALAIHTMDPGYDGSGIYIYNNVFAGSVNLGKWFNNVKENNNIFWSVVGPGHSFYKQSDLLSKSMVITSGISFPGFFKKDFFRGHYTVIWPNMKKKYAPSILLGHGKVIDFRMHKKSTAINFGNYLYQPSDSLGTLKNGFIINNGAKRTRKRHSAGCYEQKS